nr:HoxN/HupN/NixA family nickel/cobalt transporter [Nakamurella sp. PAMC28650]
MTLLCPVHEVLEEGFPAMPVSPDGSARPVVPPPGRLSRAEWRSSAVIMVVILAMNAVAWVVLLGVVAPQHLKLGEQVFGVGLGVTAFTLGMRHAFDADHIAAIDNTTRKLLADGKRPVSVGFWFALGHSTVVFVLAALVAFGVRAVAGLGSESSEAHQILGLVSTSVSGLFLLLIGFINLLALLGIVRVYRRARSEGYDAHALDAALDDRGFITRILRPLMSSIRHPAQMYPIGLLFGIGFDTATEITLLVLAGSGAAAGLPWYAVLVLPLLFTAGMSLFDTLDGAFMNVAYRWAFANPIRKVYYNLTITGLSVAVALLIGSIELIGVLHHRFEISNPVVDWIAGIDLGNVGFIVVGLFVMVWGAAIAYWKLARVEEKWSLPTPLESAVARPGTEPP